MAFPASPSNNDLHSEGNRTFVYDSALGVWDQVKQTEATSAETGGGFLGNVFSGKLGEDVVFPKGHIIQVVYNEDVTAVSHTMNSWTNLPYSGLNTEIVPRYSTSKILVMISTSLAHYGPGGDTHHVYLAVADNRQMTSNTKIGTGDNVGSVPDTTFSMRLAETHSMVRQNFNFLHSPATTSARTYGLIGKLSNTTGRCGYNMPQNDTSTDANMGRHMSTCTLMEIAQ